MPLNINGPIYPESSLAREDAAKHLSRFESKLWEKDYPQIQIVTIEGLLTGTERIDAPSQIGPLPWPRGSRRRCCATAILKKQFDWRC